MSTRSQEISDEAVQEATGKTWNEWFTLLEQLDVADLSHKEIARTLHDEHSVSGWWAQTITVEYERSTGRREVGQASDGTYQTAVSRTVAGGLDDVLASWKELVAGKSEFDGVDLSGEPAVTESENWRYWRTGLADGSRISVVIGKKDGGKSQLAVNHEKLPDKEAIDRWKQYWRSFIADV